MKDIKPLKLNKYNNEDYTEIAFNIYYNKKQKNYCFCFEADIVEQYPLEDLLDQYGVSCTEFYGQSVSIDGTEKNVVEVETLYDKKEDLIKILNFSTIAGKEILNVIYSGYELLVINYGTSNFIINNRTINVPIVADRSDRTGMSSFEIKYPEMQYKNYFSSGKTIKIEDKSLEDIKYVLLQGEKAKIIYGNENNIDYTLSLSDLK